MLSKFVKILVAPLMCALACGLALPPMANATPIVVNVTGNINSYSSYHYDYVTDSYSYNYSGDTGTLSGTFAWDPALMGEDFSAPPDYSYHTDFLGANVWLTSSLTAVTPDYTQTYNPSSSPFPLFLQSLYGQDGDTYGGRALEPNLIYFCDNENTVCPNNVIGYAYNGFYVDDYTSPLTLALGFQNGQFVPTAVDYTSNGPDNLSTIFVADFRVSYDVFGDPVDITATEITATLTSVTSPVPEPSSVLLLGAGLSALGLGAWRRRQQHGRQPS